MLCEGKKDELDESNKVILRALCWEYNTMFILPISVIGLISCDKPLILLEAREYGHERKSKNEERKVIVDFWATYI
jgi:hypothetical protein